MATFLSAHGYDPGPTQRPFLAGAISGAVATLPAIAILHLFGSLKVEAQILGISSLATIAAGIPLMAAAGAAYGRLFGRAANEKRGGWLFGMIFGFVVWAAGGVLIIPIVGGGTIPAGLPAVGVFLSLIAWGTALGAVHPFVQRPLHQSIETASERTDVGPNAAASHRK